MDESPINEDDEADDTLGPDSFPSRILWVSRGEDLQGQPPNDIRVIDIAGDGTKSDKGEVGFDQADSILQLPLPWGKSACRIIIGVPETGRMDREFVMRAVNLAGETIAGGTPGEVFKQTDFQCRICPGFDLARLRDLWTMKHVAWKPFCLTVPSARAPVDKMRPRDVSVRFSGRDVMYFRFNRIIVQTIPLEVDRFLCELAWYTPLYTSRHPNRPKSSAHYLRQRAPTTPVCDQQRTLQTSSGLPGMPPLVKSISLGFCGATASGAAGSVLKEYCCRTTRRPHWPQRAGIL